MVQDIRGMPRREGGREDIARGRGAVEGRRWEGGRGRREYEEQEETFYFSLLGSRLAAESRGGSEGRVEGAD